MASAEQLEDPRAETAIQWMVEMRSGDMTERQLRSFEAWLNGDPRNEAAWVKLQEGLMPWGVASRQGFASGALAGRVAKMRMNRRRLLTGLVGFVGLGTIGAMAVGRTLPKGALTADHFTYTGQQQQFDLADGSQILLAPRAAVDVRYQPGLRNIRILDGEVLVRAAYHRYPFRIDVDERNLSTNEGIFAIKSRSGRLSVTGIEGEGILGPVPSYSVSKSERLVIANNHIDREVADLEVDTAWTDGLLVAKDRTVASIVDDLRPYFFGVIRVSPIVAETRATAVLKLREPEASLDTLADSLGLKVSRIANYWVSIGPLA